MMIKKLKIFFICLFILHIPLLSILIPATRLFGFMPYLFWVNIPGIPLVKLGIPFIEYREFGAYPLGVVG